MKIVAFLPAKGTSNRVPSKNTKVLNGKPLFLHALDKLISIKMIDEVYLDSESEKIFSLAGDRKYKKLLREAHLADNSTDGNSLFVNEVNKIDADIYIQLLCTSPFIDAKTIEKAIQILLESDNYDSVILSQSQKLYLWSDKKPLYNVAQIPNSIDLPETISETMGLYVCRAEVPKKLGRRTGNNPFFLLAKPIETIDINYNEDFQLAEYLMRGISIEEELKFNFYSSFLSTAIVSDILDTYGVNNLVTGLTPNISETRIIGRAKTLKLREIKPEESSDLIYEALKSYDHIAMGEIIVVENELDELAYFGALNAHISKRIGIKGAIINGKTRDNQEVRSLGFPVFSKGYTAKDVKGRAVLEHFNNAINIGGVDIHPGDLIVADAEGVIVIPKEIEVEVIQKAIEVASLETNIKSDLLTGFSIKDVLNRNGNF